jgi:hypothetical protein
MSSTEKAISPDYWWVAFWLFAAHMGSVDMHANSLLLDVTHELLRTAKFTNWQTHNWKMCPDCAINRLTFANLPTWGPTYRHDLSQWCDPNR